MPNSTRLILPFLPEPLDNRQEELLDALLIAHQKAAENNNNASSMIARVVAKGSGSFTQAVCAAILSTGGAHAPLAASRTLLSESPASIHERIERGEKIPGFGNSFYKDRIDPAFAEVVALLEADWPSHMQVVYGIEALLWGSGKRVRPNASILTAVVCEIIRLPKGIEMVLFIVPRLTVWAKIVTSN